MKHTTFHPTLKEDLCKQGCRLCGRHVSWSSGGFVRHLRSNHSNLTVQLYYEIFVLGFRPICECGCGMQTSWQQRGGFYQRFVNGHNYRGKTKETDPTILVRTEKAKQHPNMIASWFQRGHETWNADLKSGDDPRWDEALAKAQQTKLQWSADRKAQINVQISQTVKMAYKAGFRTSPFKIATAAQRLEWMERASETRAKEGHFHSQRGFSNGWYISTLDGTKHHYESSYELQRMQELDVDPCVKSWKKCDFTIPFWDTTDGKLKRYTPDFLIRYHDDRVVIEEIKGWMSSETLDKAYAGMSFTLERGWKYVLLTKKHSKASNFMEIHLV